jgi:ribosomal protein S18 acetylase RimI-like enzyme
MTALVIDVRAARTSDAADLSQVYAVAWREAYSGIIPALTLERMIVRRSPGWWRSAVRGRSILVLDANGAVAGYASFAAAAGPAGASAAEIQELYLRPEYQGIGLGGRLFSAALKRIRARGYPRVVVRALAENDRANAFYLRRGGRLIAQSEETLGGKLLPCCWYEFAA